MSTLFYVIIIFCRIICQKTGDKTELNTREQLQLLSRLKATYCLWSKWSQTEDKAKKILEKIVEEINNILISFFGILISPEQIELMPSNSSFPLDNEISCKPCSLKDCHQRALKAFNSNEEILIVILTTCAHSNANWYFSSDLDNRNRKTSVVSAFVDPKVNHVGPKNAAAGICQLLGAQNVRNFNENYLMDNSNTYKDRLKLKKSTKTAVLGKVNDILRNRSLQTRIFRIQKSCISPVEIVLDFNVILTHCFRTSPLEEHTGFGRFIDIANAFTRSKMGFYIRTGYIHFMGEKYKFLNNQNCEEKCTLKGFLKEVRDNYILPKGWEGITTGFFTTCAGEYKYLAEKGIFSTSTTETIQIVYGSSKNTAKAIAASFARGFGANNVEDETLEFLMNKKHDEFRQVVIANQTVQTVCASEIEIYKRNPKVKFLKITGERDFDPEKIADHKTAWIVGSILFVCLLVFMIFAAFFVKAKYFNSRNKDDDTISMEELYPDEITY